MFSMAFPHETVRFGTSDPAHVENVEDAMQQVGTGPAWKEQAAVAAVATLAIAMGPHCCTVPSQRAEQNDTSS